MSPQPEKRFRKARFGPFEADFASGELRRDGQKLKIAGQPFDLLAMLLLRAGEVVTREEIRQRLWSEETNVEFNHGINLAMNRIRTVLTSEEGGDFQIDTLRSRGYRLVGAVELESAETVEALPATSPAALPSALPAARPTWGVDAKFVLLAVLALGLIFYGLWIRKPSTTTPTFTVVPLTDYPGAQDKAAFSQDGKFVAFLWSQEDAQYWDVYVKLVGSGEPLRLTSDTSDKASPVWSPDGREIAFIRRFPKGNNGIFIVPALGGAERRVGSITTTGVDLSWSADGRYLAFVNYDKTGIEGLRVYAIDTGEQRALPAPRDSLGDRQPVFSPDGLSIAFVRTGSVFSDTDLWVIPAAGGEARRITSDHREIVGLAWTRDGHSLIFSSNRQGLPRLWRVAVDVTGNAAANGQAPVEPVAAAGYNVLNPALSPTSLAFTEAWSNINVWRFEAHAGAGATKVLASTRKQHSPQFSPDGARIVFAADRTGAEEIWVSDRDGRNPAQLTSFKGPPTGSPRWSPDGRFIVFDARPNRNTDIYVIAREGGTPRRVTSAPSRETVPAWSRDGKWIYFCSDRTGRNEIWKTPTDGGTEVQVTHNVGFEGIESPDGRYLYYSKGREPGIWRMALAVPGAAEEPVEELKSAGRYRSWTVTPQGYYYMALEDGPYPTIYFFDSATRRKIALVSLQKPGDLNAPGLTVSPDGRTILFTQVDQRVRDIMVIPNFQ